MMIDFLVFSFNQVASQCQLMELLCILFHSLVTLPQILHRLIQCLLIVSRQKLCFQLIFHLAPTSDFSFTPHFSIILIMFPPSRSCSSQLCSNKLNFPLLWHFFPIKLGFNAVKPVHKLFQFHPTIKF